MAGTLTLRRGPTFKSVALPRALVPKGPYSTTDQRRALARLAASILAGDGRYAALRDILERRPPRVLGRAPGDAVQTIDLAAQRARYVARHRHRAARDTEHERIASLVVFERADEPLRRVAAVLEHGLRWSRSVSIVVRARTGRLIARRFRAADRPRGGQ